MLSLVNDIKKKGYANTSLIISDNNKSIGLQKAKELGLKTFILEKSKYRNLPKEFDKHLNKILKPRKYSVDLFGWFYEDFNALVYYTLGK